MSPAARQAVVAASADRWTRIQQAAGTLAALGTLAVIVFTWLSIQQVDNEHALTREGQVTDRYNAAVGNIGEDSLEVRLGGIYALQRIMEDSARDQPSVINVLSTYIRNHAKKPKPGTNTPENPTSDIQAALTALGSRNPSHDSTAHIDLDGADLDDTDVNGTDLRGPDLGGVSLRGADLDGAALDDADLDGADLRDADLDNAALRFAALRFADLHGADLRGADLHGADLRGAHLRGADLSFANVRVADLRGVNLDGVNLRGVILDEAGG
ncbi:pentapeptide repeat-containing protein [Streptomyces xinghaiensis]|uniref:pentapeptide repeat-containing protein n=1 Tax=Streptomyces xinghaiensis TaxID=1038928 RepID=UPI0002FEF008|nr:pentapeptide repeat-containing protein [Streptomyces xinghaiensis]MZE76730.1 pentapeptide repeat-containing protein [Streptomyces sp. SID5475]